MALAEGVDDGERDRGDRDADEGADRAEERGAGDDRPERDRGMDVHGAAADARGEDVVLDLLVDRREDGDPHGVDRLVEQGEEGGQGDADVGADGRDELADDAREDAERSQNGTLMNQKNVTWKTDDSAASTSLDTT